MTARRSHIGVLIVGVVVVLGGAGGLALAFQPDQGANQGANQAVQAGDLKVLGHGPVHEAFAQPTAYKVEFDVTVNKQPPAPVEELPPEEKPAGENVVWIPGYWAFDQESNDYLWVSGFWRDVPPGRVWVPGYWVEAEGGYRWVSGYWSDAEVRQTQYYPEPPEPVVEVPPPPPDAQSIYVPGIWVYQQTRYVWRPGHWIPYQQGWVWTSPRYTWTPGGYVYVDGYWDYEFNRRGVLFAPVIFGPRYFVASRVYQPQYVVATQPLLTALFVQPRFGAYYFGDYYAPRYARAGFTPWVNYRYAGRYTDPTFAYYNTRYRNDANWADSLRATYVARSSGQSAAPPRIFDRNAAAPNAAASNVNIVASMQQVQKQFNLQPISKADAAQARKQADQLQSFVKTRREVESKLTTSGPRNAPTTAQLGVPPVAAPKAASQAPPLPKTPDVNSKIAPNAPGKQDRQPAAKRPDVKDVPPPPKIDTPPPAKKDVTPPKVEPKTPKTEPTPKQPAVNQPPQPKIAPPKVEPKVDPKPTPQPQPKIAPPAPQPQPKIAPPAPKVEPKVEPKPAPQPQPKIAPPAPKVEPKPAPQPTISPPAPKNVPNVEAPRASPQRIDRPPAQQVGPRDRPNGPPAQPKGDGPRGKKKD